MLCQLCSGLDLATIMRLEVGLDFGARRIEKDDFSPEHVSDWSTFEDSDYIYHFVLNWSDPLASYRFTDSFVAFHKTLEDLYQASKECDLCQALLQSAAGIIKIRKETNGGEFWYDPPGKGYFCVVLVTVKGFS